MILRLAIAASLIALAASASGAPILRSDVTVSGAIVTAGDMFDDAGPYAELPLFRAPAPGTTGFVPASDIAVAAQRIGLSAYDAVGVTRVRVDRPGTPVDQAMLDALIAGELAARGVLATGVTPSTSFNDALPALTAERTAAPVTLLDLRYVPGAPGFSARFAIAGLDRTVAVAGRIELMVEAPHLRRSLPAGAVLSADDIVMRPIAQRFSEADLTDLGDLVGKALRRQSREGVVLKAADVAAPLLIARSEEVTLVVHTGTLTLTAKGQALGAASLGQPVQVLNLTSRKIVQGVASGPGTVAVNPQSAVAGL
jgi:flagella basal body P-ring formation protein FlgA